MQTFCCSELQMPALQTLLRLAAPLSVSIVLSMQRARHCAAWAPCLSRQRPCYGLCLAAMTAHLEAALSALHPSQPVSVEASAGLS